MQCVLKQFWSFSEHFENSYFMCFGHQVVLSVAHSPKLKMPPQRKSYSMQMFWIFEVIGSMQTELKRGSVPLISLNKQLA